MKNTVLRIKKYKELKADIVDTDIKIQELCEDEEAIREIIKDVRTPKELEIRRIDNALSVLAEPHREIIEEILIKNKNYSYMQEKLHLSYSRVKQLEKEALVKMQKYIP